MGYESRAPMPLAAVVYAPRPSLGWTIVRWQRLNGHVKRPLISSRRRYSEPAGRVGDALERRVRGHRS